MQIISCKLHEMSKSYFLENKKNTNWSFAELAVCMLFYLPIIRVMKANVTRKKYLQR